jgi:arylsulfatase A-like enzyme
VKPNIIFLMTDQQRRDALGCVNPLVKTPNLDRLAKEGILFSQAVCQTPQCVPSRYSMMLGMYSARIGVLTNGDTIAEDADLPGVPLPERFRKAGYQTAGFGKTHWNAPLRSTRGFEVRAVGQPRDSELYEEGARMMGDEQPEKLAAYFKETDPFGPGEEEAPGYIGCTSSIPPEWHRDGWVAEQCLDFIENGIDPQRPLFLYLSFLKPHAGFNVPEEFENLYRLEEIPDVEMPPWEQESGTHLACGNTPWLDARYERWRKVWEQMDSLERRRTTLRYWANCS